MIPQGGALDGASSYSADDEARGESMLIRAQKQGDEMKHPMSFSSKITTFVAVAGAIAVLALGSRPAVAGGDAALGQQVFARCAICHATVPGENKIGPSLAGVVGRESGSVPGYDYSAAMKSANITWDNDTLDKFLAGPANFVHGTKMVLSLPSSTDRENVIAYLDTLKGR